MTAVTNDFRDGISFEGQSSDIGPFTLLGGRYLLAANATWGGGSLTLKILMPDSSTYVAVTSGALTADGTLELGLPSGTYELAIATATAVQGSLSRIPYRGA
jgi:hypothetical protein